MGESTTIVTAFFDFPEKKHTSQRYIEWMKNFLPNTSAPMVIYTDEGSYDMIQTLRSAHADSTIIIKTRIEDFHCYKMLDYWNRDLTRDHERGYHNTALYMIWNEKSMFIKRAMDSNYFSTEYFMWCDIGMVREERHIKHLTGFPSTEFIRTLQNRVYLLSMGDFTEEELKMSGATDIFRYKNKIGGGVIFGHRDVLKVWVHEYYKMLDEFMKNDCFAGKDQSVMACVYLKNRDLIHLVRPRPSPFDSPYGPWFYMLYFFGNRVTGVTGVADVTD